MHQVGKYKEILWMKSGQELHDNVRTLCIQENVGSISMNPTLSNSVESLGVLIILDFVRIPSSRSAASVKPTCEERNVDKQACNALWWL